MDTFPYAAGPKEVTVQLALDPYMLRRVPLIELPAVVAKLGYEYIELSPREDFIPFFHHPRVSATEVSGFKAALAAAGVELASVPPLFRWSGPHEDERQAAVRYWKRAIQIAVGLGCPVMNSELNGRPEAPDRSESQFWRSMEELLPIIESEGIDLHLEAHPDDHRASSGLRYIINPPGSPARVHQHLDIGQGEVDWDEFFGTLDELHFDGIMTACVFAWEERAEESSIFMRERIEAYTGHWVR